MLQYQVRTFDFMTQMMMHDDRAKEFGLIVSSHPNPGQPDNSCVILSSDHSSSCHLPPRLPTPLPPSPFQRSHHVQASEVARSDRIRSFPHRNCQRQRFCSSDRDHQVCVLMDSCRDGAPRAPAPFLSLSSHWRRLFRSLATPIFLSLDGVAQPHI